MTNDKKTILYDAHIAAGARMVPFGGWEMPVQYEGVKAEHLAVRQHCGIFDVSHMGNVVISGERVAEALEKLTPWPMSQLKHSKAKYTVFPNPEGGVVDDLIVYRRGDNEYFIIWNASNHQKNLDWTADTFDQYDVELVDHTDQTALIALQGPDWQNVYKAAVSEDLIPEGRFSFLEFDDLTVVRTGYTGEDGVEIWLPNDRATGLWQNLLDAGAKPCGLGARDSLRIEAGLPLYGHELTDQIGPVAGGVGFVLSKKSDHGYIGKQQMQHHPNQKIVGVKMVDKGVPREGYQILDDTETEIGKVTSGSYSPVLDCGIGLALVSTEKNMYDGDSQRGFVSIRGRNAAIELVRPPIHKN